MLYDFEERIPSKNDIVFFEFSKGEKVSYKKAYFWTYDEYLKVGYFNVKNDFTPYPISPKTIYWIV